MLFEKKRLQRLAGLKEGMEHDKLDPLSLPGMTQREDEEEGLAAMGDEEVKHDDLCLCPECAPEAYEEEWEPDEDHLRTKER